MESVTINPLTALKKANAGDYSLLRSITGKEDLIEAAFDLACGRRGEKAEIRAEAYRFIGGLHNPTTVPLLTNGLYDFGDAVDREPEEVSRAFYYGEVVQRAAMEALGAIETREALVALEGKLADLNEPTPSSRFLCKHNVDRKSLEGVIEKLRQKIAT